MISCFIKTPFVNHPPPPIPYLLPRWWVEGRGFERPSPVPFREMNTKTLLNMFQPSAAGGAGGRLVRLSEHFLLNIFYMCAGGSLPARSLPPPDSRPPPDP